MGHYDELGVAPSASPAEIRRSYLALARQFHPDHLSDVPAAERERAAARMARINAAWSVLSDRDRRAAYDEAGGTQHEGTNATIRDVGNSWIAFDPEDDEIDPRLLDDTPTGAPTLRRGLTFIPAALGAVGFVLVLVGVVIGLVELAAIGLMLLAGAGLGFVVLPLIALANSSRADKDW